MISLVASAQSGTICMVPDFYYRNGKRLHFEFRNENNETISINRLEGQALREIQARPKLSNKMVMDDTGAILKFLDGAQSVRRGGVGAIGYCMGGRYVMGAAGTYPEHFVASASLHGTTLISDRDDSPHLLAANLRGEFIAALPSTTPTRRCQWCRNWRRSCSRATFAIASPCIRVRSTAIRCRIGMSMTNELHRGTESSSSRCCSGRSRRIPLDALHRPILRINLEKDR